MDSPVSNRVGHFTGVSVVTDQSSVKVTIIHSNVNFIYCPSSLRVSILINEWGSDEIVLPIFPQCVRSMPARDNDGVSLLYE